jgi:hypothetical protein
MSTNYIKRNVGDIWSGYFCATASISPAERDMYASVAKSLSGSIVGSLRRLRAFCEETGKRAELDLVIIKVLTIMQAGKLSYCMKIEEKFDMPTTYWKNWKRLRF